MRPVTVLTLLALAALCLAGPAGEWPASLPPPLPCLLLPQRPSLLWALSWAWGPGGAGLSQTLSFADAKPSGAESRRGAGMGQGLWGVRGSPRRPRAP